MTRAAPPLPGPRGMPAYARLASLRGGAVLEPLAPRLTYLTAQLAALRSGCAYCVQHNRHLALQAGLPAGTVDAVSDYQAAAPFSEAERAALALTDAVTGYAETAGGFADDILARARRHFAEPQIMAIVAAVAREHFFDPGTGRMGRDVIRG